jgi:aprataxin
VDSEELPEGRDWEKEVIVGVHANPAITQLHVHVLSVDMHSKHILHKKHYNSFQTPFFIDLAEFPLSKRAVRTREQHLRSDLKCWRCGKNFGNGIAQLKDHLAEEFEEWKAE